ncbi:hypothetical protein NHB34_01815 [Polynucleobacter sp. MWH-UH19D]|uniref:hypothetical protein n=1 Tax=Polynucleobacter sp. MWH-UH19D TaxID=1855610 RepID=UPI003364C136
MMQLGGVQRASDELNRAMIRAIDKCRKHHEWGLQNWTEQLPSDDAKQLTSEWGLIYLRMRRIRKEE